MVEDVEEVDEAGVHEDVAEAWAAVRTFKPTFMYMYICDLSAENIVFILGLAF